MDDESSILCRLKDIGLTDLQKAVKYGVKSSAGYDPHTMKPLLKYTYAHADYITDESGAIEIGYQPDEYLNRGLVEYPASINMLQSCAEERHRNQARRQITSHMIVVVDQSGSMRNIVRNTDITRLQAVYKTIAVELVAKRLNDCTATYTDVLSVITMQDGAACVLDCHPFNWLLYNKILALSSSLPYSHGNYLPAIRLVHDYAMRYQDLKRTPVAVMLLSDGAPSDTRSNGPDTLSSMEFLQSLYESIVKMSHVLGSRLTFNTTLFTSDYQRLEYHGQVLRKMTNKAVENGAQGIYDRGSGSGTLHGSFSSMITTMTATKTHLQEWGDAELSSKYDSQTRDTQKAKSANDPEFKYNHYFRKNDALKRFTFVPHKKGAQRWNVAVPPTGIEIQDAHFGVGAERIVRYMEIIDVFGTVVSAPLVAKEAKTKGGHIIGKDFHIPFFTTQALAQEQANNFNEAVDKVGVSTKVPRVSFVTCELYAYNDEVNNRQWILAEKRLDESKYIKWNDNNGHVRGTREDCLRTNANETSSEPIKEIVELLATLRVGKTVEFDPCEHVLKYDPYESVMNLIETGELASDSEEDSSEGEGYEDGSVGTECVQLCEEVVDVNNHIRDVNNDIPPDSQCVSSNEILSHNSVESHCITTSEVKQTPDITHKQLSSPTDTLPMVREPVKVDTLVVELEKKVLEDDVPQAFTHFTYAHTKRALMVCDLQGVLDRSQTPAMFEFTDPCIHHHDTNQQQARRKGKKKRRARRKVFGRTDLDRRGMHQFFRTHVCNALCEILGIDKVKEIDRNAGEQHPRSRNQRRRR
ncbi:hypothetical protein SARC_10273 [Sphaeroforma arctica JP610]|uniref:Alpha-type protein kinase domain-containing protein n=1 Tax=Sphaeroforma arctica JP610 TaxID=667725 RepID=A0A0L0FKG4_9EUKA|nr:hypothetical protein SARC_10273 [Sphaeroforma arctica JP610]KNC77264.1 hypothetical protein SARC_10273 [Sphaeroforma arctica JP610]|eukprot:XP_014151166.1 hypothetical protein SARC_10273 [Sphaeroforma arctica JP610]